MCILGGGGPNTRTSRRSGQPGPQASIADRCDLYQRGPSYQIALKHCISSMFPRHFDHAAPKVGWILDFNNGIRRQGSHYARFFRFVRPTQADRN